MQGNYKRSDTDSQILIMDLIGPFVIHFCDEMVRIHAPACDGHHANILTDHNDISLWGSATNRSDPQYPKPGGDKMPAWVYGFASDKSPDPGNCDPSNSNSTLVLENSLPPIDEHQCHLVFEVPRPDAIFPLVPEWIWIHKNGSQTWFANCDDIREGEFARGLRLRYDSCRVNPRLELRHPDWPKACQEMGLCTLDCSTVGLDSPRYHLSLRFASVNDANDAHHEDAYNCFHTMRGLVSGAGTWRVDFDDSIAPLDKCLQDIVSDFNPAMDSSVLSMGTPHPVDCQAAVVVIPGVVRS